MRFSRQLIIGHAALLLVTIVTGTMAAIALSETSSRLEEVTRELATEVIDVHRLRFQAEQAVATSRGFLLTGDQETWKRFEASAAKVKASLDALHDRHAMGEDVVKIDEAASAYVAAAETAAKLRTATGDPREIVPMLETILTPARERFEESIAVMLRGEQTEFDQASHDARAFARRARLFVLMTTVLGIGLSVALAWLSIRKLRGHYERERKATASAKRASNDRDELLAIVSHDLRSPLSAIAMGSSLLDEHVADAPARKYVTAIQNATERMQHLIDQLLDTAQLEAGLIDLRLEPVDVGELLRTVEELFAPRAQAAGVRLAVGVEKGLATNADRERLMQVLSNLVGNGLKFTPTGGSISLSSSAVGGGVRFEVRDTGEGIPAEQVPHLFERHWQGRLRGRGSLGLGLYISKHLVEAHGGRIGVRTALGQGTTFWFELPGRASASVSAAGASQVATPVTTERAHRPADAIG